MKVLLVKLSSMGDILHMMPAISEALDRVPDLSIDWLVEENLADMARWHPGVHEVIPVGLRRWLRRPGPTFLREWKDLRQRIKASQYDLLIDCQGILKVALLARSTGISPRHGHDRSSAREPLSSLFLTHRHPIPRDQHAILRNRQTMGAALSYEPTGIPSFGLQNSFPRNPEEKKRLVLVPGTTWSTKHWPDSSWEGIVQRANREEIPIEIIWGNEAERDRAEYLAEDAENALVATERLSLSQVAARLAQSWAVIGVDTGFTHLAGALEVPTIGLFGPTSPERVGLFGKHTRNLTPTPSKPLPCIPCHKRSCQLLPKNSSKTPPCWQSTTPNLVWTTLLDLQLKLGERD